MLVIETLQSQTDSIYSYQLMLDICLNNAISRRKLPLFIYVFANSMNVCNNIDMHLILMCVFCIFQAQFSARWTMYLCYVGKVLWWVGGKNEFSFGQNKNGILIIFMGVKTCYEVEISDFHFVIYKSEY